MGVERLYLDAKRLGVARDTARILLEKRLDLWPRHDVCLSDRQAHAELSVARDALDLAGEIVDLGRDLYLVAEIAREACGREQEHLVGIAVGGQEAVRLGEDLGCWPLELARLGSVDAPLDQGRKSGLTGVSPVDVPAPIEAEEQAYARTYAGVDGVPVH